MRINAEKQRITTYKGVAAESAQAYYAAMKQIIEQKVGMSG
jgi:hypothetical protein